MLFLVFKNKSGWFCIDNGRKCVVFVEIYIVFV